MKKQFGGITLFGLIFISAVALVSIYLFAPAIVDSASGIVDRFFVTCLEDKWPDDRKRSNPVGFLEFSKCKMKKGIEAIEENLENMREVQSKLDSNYRLIEPKASKGHTLLAASRAKWNDTFVSYPIHFKGGEYRSKEEFFKQIGLWLSETATYDSQLESTKLQQAKIDAKRPELEEKLANIKVKYDSMDTWIALATTEKNTAEIESTIRVVDGTLKGLNHTLSGLRRVDDVQEDSGGNVGKDAAASIVDAKVRTFLKSADQPF